MITAHCEPSSTSRRARRQNKLALALLPLWLACVVGGMIALWRYGANGVTADLVAWPAQSSLAPHRDRPTLLVFAHPHCPCTGATLAELSGLLAEFAGRVDARILFCHPSDASVDWWQTDHFATALAIRGLRVGTDEHSAEAENFGASTSGHVVMYSPGGQVLFSGGITVTRGHVGANPGRQALTAILRGEEPATRRTQVFGCPLASQANTL